MQLNEWEMIEVKFKSRTALKQYVAKSVDPNVASILEFPVRYSITFTDVLGVQIPRYLGDDLAHDTLLDYIVGKMPDEEVEAYRYDVDTYEGLTIDELVVKLKESGMYVAVG